VAPDGIGIRVANLTMWLDGTGTGIPLAAPACYRSFLAADGVGGGLTLRVRHGPPSGTDGWQSVFYDDKTWQLWRDSAERHVFVAPRGSLPRRQVAVDAAFHEGEVVGEFGPNLATEQAIYPLQDVDILLYTNWLALSGDLIIHASGIDDDGGGYAFVGPSGAGKSTLIDAVASDPAVTVLGEDQVIVRCQEGRFLVYGTPWHSDPSRCSPGGVPLKKLFFIDRAAGHRAEPCGPRAGIERLLQDAFIPYYNHAGVERILDNLPRLAEQVPFYTLGFRLGADVIRLIRDA